MAIFNKNMTFKKARFAKIKVRRTHTRISPEVLASTFTFLSTRGWRAASNWIGDSNFTFNNGLDNIFTETTSKSLSRI